MVSIRAIYRDGALQLLDLVDLREGQEVQLQIMSDESSLVRTALSDVMVQTEQEDTSTSELNETALQGEIDKATQGITLSDLIIDERHSSQ